MRREPVAAALGAGRVAVGAALLASPELAERLLGGDVRRPGARAMTRAMGVRDLALGLGVLAAARDGAHLRRWLAAGALADAGDFAAASALAPSWRRTVVMATAGGASVAGLALWAATDS